MAIADQIQALNDGLLDAYDAVSVKGGTVPASKNLDNLPDAIESISGGGISEVESVTINNKSDFANITLPSTAGYYVTIPLNVTVLPATAPQITQVTVSDTKKAAVVDNGNGTHSIRIWRGGQITITVKDYSGTITDTVTANAASELQDIRFPYTSINVAEGGTRQLNVIFVPSTASNQDIVYSSDNPNAISVDENGLVTATTTGHATISAYSAALEKTITVNIESAAYIDTPDWAQIQADVQAGTSTLGVGSTITDTYDDNGTEREIVWRVVAHKNVTKKNGAVVPGMYLMCESEMPTTKPLISNGGKFSYEQRVESDPQVETTAQPDTYYFGYDGSTYTALNLAVGDVIPYGDYTTIYKTGLPFTKSLSNVAQTYINAWRGSTWRAYLNSEAENVKDNYEPDHITDYVNFTGKGFLYGLNPNMLAVLNEVAVTTHYNNACFDGQAYVTYDKMFLPSKDEINGAIIDATVQEGQPWQYFVDQIGARSDSAAASRARIPWGATAAAEYWLRSANRTTSSTEWYVTSSGALSTNYVSSNYCRVAPACVIC